MSKNVIASTGPSEDQIAARSVSIPEHPTLAATDTESVQKKGNQPRSLRFGNLKQRVIMLLISYSTRLSPVSQEDCHQLQSRKPISFGLPISPSRPGSSRSYSRRPSKNGSG